MLHCNYLRNRKHVPCFYWAIETRVEGLENEKCCGTQAAGECFYSFFEFSQTFMSFSICNLTETRTCFLFLLENIVTRKRKTTCSLILSKSKISLLAPSLHQNLVLKCLSSVSPSSYRNTIYNQSAWVFS